MDPRHGHVLSIKRESRQQEVHLVSRAGPYLVVWEEWPIVTQGAWCAVPGSRG
jgi:hypothetical protein